MQLQVKMFSYYQLLLYFVLKRKNSVDVLELILFLLTNSTGLNFTGTLVVSKDYPI